jgi:ribosome-associated heat shock protein Hsp15
MKWMQKVDRARISGMETQRLDTWLWVARLIKTRSLANEAVTGGRVHVDGQRAKPSRAVRAGDRIEITLGPTPRTVVVRGLAPRRGPASEAALLYEETPESVEARERAALERRLSSPQPERGAGRPTKRDRRRLDRERGRR